MKRKRSPNRNHPPSTASGASSSKLILLDDLAVAAKNGSIVSLATLFERDQGRLMRLARRHARPGTAPEDVCQDAQLNILKGLNTFEPDRATYRTWSAAVVCNAAKKAVHRVRSHLLGDADTELADNRRSETLPLEDREIVGLAQDRLQQMGHGVLAILELRFAGGLKCAKVAEELGVALGTVTSKCSRGLAMLKRKFCPLEPAA